MDYFKDILIKYISTYDPYEYDMENRILGSPYEELDTTPEASENYLNAELMLLRGDTLYHSCVIWCKRNADGNHIGVSNENPILYNFQYQVDF